MVCGSNDRCHGEERRMTVRFLQVSDTHWNTTPVTPGVESARRSNLLCDWIRGLNAPIDFVVHTGDLVHRGHIPEDDGESTRAALVPFQALPQPCHFVIGNHDNRTALRNALGECPGQPLVESSERWAYRFTVRGEQFLILDARDTTEIDPLGRLDEKQLESIQKVLHETREPTTLFVHYAPLAMDCDWIDRTMLLTNGEALHRMLATHSERIRGVFFGHIHRPTCFSRDGILYASCGSAAMHLSHWPSDTTPTVHPDPIAFANYVSIGHHGALVKTHWIPIPS